MKGRKENWSLEYIEQLAAREKSDYAISLALGMNRNYVSIRKKKDPAFAEAIERGKAQREKQAEMETEAAETAPVVSDGETEDSGRGKNGLPLADEATEDVLDESFLVEIEKCVCEKKLYFVRDIADHLGQQPVGVYRALGELVGRGRLCRDENGSDGVSYREPRSGELPPETTTGEKPFERLEAEEIEEKILAAVDARYSTVNQIKRFNGWALSVDLSARLEKLCWDDKLTRVENEAETITAFFRPAKMPKTNPLGKGRFYTNGTCLEVEYADKAEVSAPTKAIARRMAERQGGELFVAAEAEPVSQEICDALPVKTEKPKANGFRERPLGKLSGKTRRRAKEPVFAGVDKGSENGDRDIVVKICPKCEKNFSGTPVITMEGDFCCMQCWGEYEESKTAQREEIETIGGFGDEKIESEAAVEPRFKNLCQELVKPRRKEILAVEQEHVRKAPTNSPAEMFLMPPGMPTEPELEALPEPNLKTLDLGAAGNVDIALNVDLFETDDVDFQFLYQLTRLVRSHKARKGGAHQ